MKAPPRNLRAPATTTYLISHILRNHALLVLDPLQVLGILPAKLGRQRDDDCGEPHQEYHREDPIARPRVNVVDVGHCPVPEGGGDGPGFEICLPIALHKGITLFLGMKFEAHSQPRTR